MTWPTIKLGEICEIITPGVKQFSGNKKYVATANVNLDKILNFTEITYKKRPSRANMETKENDILVAKMAGTKKFLVADKDLQDNYIFSTGFAILRTKKELLPKYLFYFFTTKNFNLQKDKLAVGATQKAINNPALKKIKLPIPSFSIQRKIVERLNAIKKTQELNDKQITLADELFQGLLHKELKSKKDWKIRRIKEAVREITYGISISVVSNLDPVNGVPIITMADITADGQIDFNKVRKIKLKPPDTNKFKLEKGDLLFNWRNASKELIGKTAIFENNIKTINASFLLKIKCGSSLLNYYLYYYLNYLRKIGFFKNRCKFSANNTINASELKQIKIPLPPIETQRKIVEKLSAVQEYKKKLIEQKSKLQELFESILSQLFK